MGTGKGVWLSARHSRDVRWFGQAGAGRKLQQEKATLCVGAGGQTLTSAGKGVQSPGASWAGGPPRARGGGRGPWLSWGKGFGEVVSRVTVWAPLHVSTHTYR